MKNNLTNYDTRVNILIVSIIIILSMVYFYPSFTGKTLIQSDITAYKGMSKEIRDFNKTSEEETLWTNSMFGGMPAYLISTKFPGNILDIIQTGFKRLFRPAAMLILYILGFYLLLVTLGVNKWTSLIGAVAYGLSSYLILII